MTTTSTSSSSSTSSTGTGHRRRHVVVGTGGRAQMYLEALASTHADVGEVVALVDTNEVRMAYYDAFLAERGRPVPSHHGPEGFERLLERERPDAVIVTSPDHTHARYVAAALRAGVDVVCEKPLTVDADGLATVVAAARASTARLVVTFNYRYSPRNSTVRRLIRDGEVGEVTSVHFEWLLDTAHGADYFRRWHRRKESSGGLLVHKSSHHFDLVNWWLADVPARVFASGGLRFYGAENAARRGLGPRPERGSTDSLLRDAFSLDLRRDDALRELYLEQEHHDGYRRDADVFDEGITIEDNLSLVVDYAAGATMSYSLNAHAPWEGYVVGVNGTAGRAELTVVERGSVVLDADGRAVVDPSMHPELVVDDTARPVSERLVVQRHFGTAREVPIPSGAGGHGGGDAVLLRDVFTGAGEDPLGRTASWRDGVRSVVVGIAGNRSLATGAAVRTADLDLGAASAALGGVTA